MKNCVIRESVQLQSGRIVSQNRIRMGVQKATHAYAQIYGHNDKRVLRTGDPPPPPEAGVIALVDVPTYHVPTVSSLATKTAIAVNNNGSKLGQLVLFCNSDNVIHDSLFDADVCLSQEDIDTVVSEAGHVKSVKNYKLSFYSRSRSFMESFSSKVKKWIRPQCSDMRVVLVPVVFPLGCVDTLKSFISEGGIQRSPEVAMPVSGSGDAARGNCCGHKAFREWLNMNKVKEGRFINFDHLYNVICGSKSSENHKYGCAVVTQSMEGILLTYGHFMVNKIKKLISDRFAKRKQTTATANSAVLFYDGKIPVIKNYRRFKREEAKRQRFKNKDNETPKRVTPETLMKELMVLCEKTFLMIPHCIYRVAFLDVFRLPLFEQLSIDNLYMTVTDGSEAEDDMVRLTAFAANINTGIRGDKKSLLKLGRGDPRGVKSDIFSNNYLKTNVDWTTVCTETLFKNPGTSVDMYSSDSDILAKWDSLVRHAAESPHCIRGGGVDDDLSERMKRVAGNIKSIFFFRSLVKKGGGVAAREDMRALPTASMDGSDDDDRLMLGKRKIVALDDDDGFRFSYYDDRIGSRSCSNNNFDIYDLTQSPVLRSVESTLQLMVVNGCDYVDPLVSPDTASKFDVLIREEISLFEKFACMCVLTKEDNEKLRLLSYKQRQLQMQENLRCPLCDKTKVLEFLEVKRFFVNRANLMYSRFPKAVNAAANIMALLSLSCFNQKIFGSISGLDDKNKIKVAVEVSNSIRKARNIFFCEHTQGGIPMYGDCAVASAVNKDRSKIFEHLGIDEYMKDIPSREEYMIKNSASFIQVNQKQNRKFRFKLGNISPKQEKRRDKEETIHDILSFGMDKEEEIEGMVTEASKSIFTDIWFDGKEENEDTTILTTTTTSASKKANVNDKDYDYDDDEDCDISQLLLQKENMNDRSAAVAPPTVSSPLSDHNNRDNIQNIEHIVSAMTSSTTGTEDYILSLLTNILSSNSTTRGIDDSRSKRMSYSEKVMDLLVILYLNICGLQDPANDHMYREDGSREQYIPIIHAELCGKASPFGTTRNYFVSALYEMSLAMYRYGLSEGCSLPQARRRKRDIINKKLELYDNEMSMCKVEVFYNDIKAVYGTARVRPWSTLALLGAKLFYEARIHNSSNGLRSRNISA